MRFIGKLALLPVLFTTAWLSFAWMTPPEANFQAQTIDDEVQIGYGLAIGEMNGDGKPDVVLVDKTQIVWYENPGWTRQLITENLSPRDNVCAAVRDIDGDGLVEIAAGANWNPRETQDLEKSGSVHYLIRPTAGEPSWKTIRLHHEPTVHRMRWVRGEDGYQLVVVPLHGRGNTGGEGQGVRILAYEAPEDPSREWRTRLVDDSLHITHNFDPVQWDTDAAEELLVGGREGIYLMDPQASGWSRTRLAGGDFGGAGEVRGGKLANGKRFIAAVEPWHGQNLVLYSEEESGWKRSTLDSTLSQGHALAAADLDGSGSDQIIIGWREPNAQGKVGIKIFRALDAQGTNWESQVLDEGIACEDLRVADLDGDGRPEIVAAGRDSHNLVIYWNRTPGAGR